LLLNIPPDKRGLIHENDFKNMQEWKRLRDETFDVNLLKSSKIKSNNGKNKGSILDGKYSTFWTTKRNDESALITFQLKSTQTFDVLLLQENLKVGQRIEKFLFEYKIVMNGKRL
jgi:alpha-L-fucosidase